MTQVRGKLRTHDEELMAHNSRFVYVADHDSYVADAWLGEIGEKKPLGQGIRSFEQL